jgi:hypothetical protein
MRATQGQHWRMEKLAAADSKIRMQALNIYLWKGGSLNFNKPLDLAAVSSRLVGMVIINLN